MKQLDNKLSNQFKNKLMQKSMLKNKMKNKKILIKYLDTQSLSLAEHMKFPELLWQSNQLLETTGEKLDQHHSLDAYKDGKKVFIISDFISVDSQLGMNTDISAILSLKMMKSNQMKLRIT